MFGHEGGRDRKSTACLAVRRNSRLPAVLSAVLAIALAYNGAKLPAHPADLPADHTFYNWQVLFVKRFSSNLVVWRRVVAHVSPDLVNCCRGFGLGSKQKNKKKAFAFSQQC